MGDERSMSARFQGRGRLTTDTCWAQSRDDIEAVVLVGSFAREGPVWPAMSTW